MKIGPSLVKKLFELGLMGSRFPSASGRARASCVGSRGGGVPASTAVGVMVDVQNTLVNIAPSLG
jgi:hypothetical protein